MAPVQHKSKAKPKPHDNVRVQKRKREHETIESLTLRINQLDGEGNDAGAFDKLPLSKPTLTGLQASHFRTMTDIQKKTIPLALKGRDILGAAKTGSGKTLTFVVPVLEKLYRERWERDHGLAALILSPTRELATQIFQVLRRIGRYHTFSAGQLIGGKSLQEERAGVGSMNILVATPGRMLQHMDQTVGLDISNLQLLVLDEADRIMDMGFQSTVDAIIEHLPKGRQTLLFSATQTKRVSDLARLSLKDPEYISVHEKADTATPATLKQNYIITPLHEKIDTLWSFLRANTKSKILVFLSSGKQVRFLFEALRLLQPGIPLMHLHGRQKQTARMDITRRFASARQACLFATDVVARGLDFPAVDWVVQVDCPEDVDTYIHRVGRTARFERDGRAILFLEPSEEAGMLKRLEQRKIPIEMIKVRPNKQHSIRDQLQERCFKDPDIKYLGQKAFITYVRSIYIQQDKEIFKVQELPLEQFAASLGLAGAPKIKFQKGADPKAIKNRSRAQLSSDEEDTNNPVNKQVRTKYDRMFERQNQDILASHREKIYDSSEGRRDGDSSGEEGEFLAVKGRLDDLVSEEEDEASKTEQHDLGADKQMLILRTAKGEEIPIDSKKREKMIRSKKAMLKFKEKGKKIIYDDDGNVKELYQLDDEEAFRKRGAPDVLRQQFVSAEAEKVRANDMEDKQLVKDKRREKREKMKARQRAEAEESGDDGGGRGGIPLVPFEDPFAEGDEASDSEADTGSAGSGDGILLSSRAQEVSRDEPSDTNKSRSKRRKLGAAVGGAETLEDLEALAKSLL